uniref:Engulfment and cell motility 1 n=1 Tax=Hucho hucho TaxID=62062 RepID=A0A4W5QTI6_9TELE
MPPPSDIVKVAIEWPGAFPKLMEIDQKKPLSAIIKEVCEGWSLGNHENFALQNADSTNFYITEKNRNDIKNGSILRLTTSPVSLDYVLKRTYWLLLLCFSFGDLLSFTLTAFVELMDHGIVSWDTFSVAFIKKIAGYVNKSAMDTAVLQRSLAILESMVLNSQDLYQKVAQEITIGQLIPHLQGADQDIQTYTIAVINALFLKAPEDKRQEMAHILAQKQLRSIILSVSVPSHMPSICTSPLHHWFNLSLLFPRFLLINHVNPAMDFTQIPPGMLALDNMLYFARHHQDAYIRIVLENSSREDKHECPFGRSSIELTKMLCETLKVGELPSENCHDFHPMFFTHDRSFEEFFCICIQLLNKTWKEMRATSEDFNKVMQVVRDQIMRALTQKPNSLDQLKSRLQNLSYTEILKIRQSERMNQEDFQSRPILELREKIQPEIMELIKQQRLNRLCDGTCFRKISSRRRQDKFWYCRLSPNHKVLHYGDLEESPLREVPHDLLQEKLPVADIKAVVTGKDCPHMKEKGALKQNKEVLELAFSVLYESDEYLNFIAPDKHEYCVWTDGLNALLGKEMTSDFTKSDMDTLLSMEMKLRLLDLENIQIPEAPPPIPKEPSNYDFVYDCN